MSLRIYLKQTHNASPTNYSPSKINTAISVSDNENIYIYIVHIGKLA